MHMRLILLASILVSGVAAGAVGDIIIREKSTRAEISVADARDFFQLAKSKGLFQGLAKNITQLHVERSDNGKYFISLESVRSVSPASLPNPAPGQIQCYEGKE
jgi:hypothetical protein